MRNLISFLVLLSLSLWSCDLATSFKEVRCPIQQVDDWKFPQTARHNITGYNLVRRFSLLKTPAVKKIRNPRGPVILRLGNTALIHPTDQVFPYGLPDEFTLVFTLLLKKKTLRDNISLFQISDEQGYPQFSLDLNGPDATLSLRARGADPLGEPVGCVFRGEGVESILDSGWHKLALSVQQRAASLHVDCSSIQTKPLEPRGKLSTEGHTLLGIRATDAAPVEMDIQQVMVYCDSSLAIQESCCEIPGARCPPDAPKSRRAAENDLEQPVLAFNRDILGSQGLSEKCAGCVLLNDDLNLASVGQTGQHGMKGEKGDRGSDCSGSGTCKDGRMGQKGEKGESMMPANWGEAVGHKGDKGQKGEVGLQGLSGTPGKDGRTGSICVVGPKGQKGTSGKVGPEGLAGEPGNPGLPGLPGIGKPGLPGIPGGPPGSNGAKGDSGTPGKDGEPGDPGPRGPGGSKGEIR
ncbi:hypothetical protein J4Q44_G00064840 [Coregonus suidteri]|uniref:Collagen alpha-1(XVI) chain n=1 Tax=Coregonus suidteri TaxID=861788 RepID=A0AAN8MHP5_9TELE